MKASLDDELTFGIECLAEALKVLTDGRFNEYQENMSVEFMQCIARVRFGMCLAADVFCQYYCVGAEEREKLSRATKMKMEELQHTVYSVIIGVLREPRDFLIKQIVRQFGFPYLNELSKQFEWLSVVKSKVRLFE